MGKIVKRNQPCLDPVCGSSDGRQIYEDGTSFCFVCTTFFKAGEEFEVAEIEEPVQKSYTPSLTVEKIKELPIRGFAERKIEKSVTGFFRVRVAYDSEGSISAHYYPYESETAYKVRTLPKKFKWVGNSKALFGQELFANGGKRLVITEGEIDAMSVAQATFTKYNRIYPVVAMSSSVMTESLLLHRDWIRSFAEVVLCLDNDKAGQEATTEAIRIVGVDKVRLTKLSHKDANEVLVQSGADALMACIFNAAPYIPSGIITKEALWEALVSYNSASSHPYPPCLEGINTKLKGKRGGEIALFVSGTGSGKSTMLREIELHVLETTTEPKIGIMHLEESPAETARKLAGMAVNKNPAAEEIPIEELQVGFEKVFGSDRVITLDHQGSLSDSSLIDKLEYMALSGCEYLFIDHITIMISEGVGDLTGNEAQDKVMNDLLRLVKRYPKVWIGLVSHLRKTPGQGRSFEEGKLPSMDDIRGSGSTKQIAFDIISFARNLTGDSEEERNTIKVRILKSRYSGLTGMVPGAIYDYPTGRLKPVDNFEDVDDIC